MIFQRKFKYPFTYLNKYPKNGHPKFAVFRKNSKSFLKIPSTIYALGEGNLWGVLQKKIKIAFTYSHWEKPFAHPNSELFTKSLKIPFTYSHREKTFVRPNSEIFTKNSKSPLIMFALGRGKLG